MNKKDCDNIGRIIAVLPDDSDIVVEFIKLDNRINESYMSWREFFDRYKYANRINELMSQITKEYFPHSVVSWGMMRDKAKQHEIRDKARTMFVSEAVDEDDKSDRENYIKYH